MGPLKKVINRLITCSQNFNAHILMNDGHMDIQEFWLKQLKKWSKEDLLGWGCFVWDWIWGICIFLKSRSNIEFSDINHHPSSSLSSLQTVCRPTLQFHDIRILISASAGLIMLARPPQPNILTGKTFCKTEKQRWYAKFCSSFTNSPFLIFYYQNLQNSGKVS